MTRLTIALTHQPTYILCMALALALLPACDQGPAPAAATTSKAATAATTTAKPKPSATKPDLKRFFTGKTGTSMVALPKVDIPGANGVTMRIALDWRRKIKGNKLRLSWDLEGEILIQAGLAKIGMSQVSAAATEMKLTDVKWEKPVSGELGNSRLAAKIGEGTCKLEEREALCYHFDAELPDKKRMLIVAGIKTRDKRARENLYDSLRSIRVKR